MVCLENNHSRELKAQEGVGFFQYKCSKLGYLFREVVHHDEGVDCEIEITQSIPVESSNFMPSLEEAKQTGIYNEYRVCCLTSAFPRVSGAFRAIFYLTYY